MPDVRAAIEAAREKVGEARLEVSTAKADDAYEWRWDRVDAMLEVLESGLRIPEREARAIERRAMSTR